MMQSNPCDSSSQEDFILVTPRKRSRRPPNFYQPGTGRGPAQVRARCTGHPSRGKSDVGDRGRSSSAEPPAPSSSSGRPPSPTCDTAINEPAANLNSSSVFQILANHPDSDVSSDDDEEDENDRDMPIRRSTRTQKRTIFYAPPQQESQRRRRRPAHEPETVDIVPPLTNMDGSFTPESPGRGSSAGWGVVIVANGGLPGPTENEGDVVQELYGKVLVNKGTNFLKKCGESQIQQHGRTIWYRRNSSIHPPGASSTKPA